MLILVSGLLLGLLIGLRHAFEPDHLAAVSSLAVENRGVRHGAIVGALWGLGHTVMLLVAATVLLLLQTALPARLADGFELLVAVMLIVLGARGLHQALLLGGDGPAREHAHGHRLHTHGSSAAHVHVSGSAVALRPLLIGLVHGLAGSGALTALILSRMPTTGLRLFYAALFGLGSIVGMSLLSALMSWPLARLASHRRWRQGLFGATGAVSLALGVASGWPLLLRVVG